MHMVGKLIIQQWLHRSLSPLRAGWLWGFWSFKPSWLKMQRSLFSWILLGHSRYFQNLLVLHCQNCSCHPVSWAGYRSARNANQRGSLHDDQSSQINSKPWNIPKKLYIQIKTAWRVPTFPTPSICYFEQILKVGCSFGMLNSRKNWTAFARASRPRPLPLKPGTLRELRQIWGIGIRIWNRNPNLQPQSQPLPSPGRPRPTFRGPVRWIGGYKLLGTLPEFCSCVIFWIEYWVLRSPGGISG